MGEKEIPEPTPFPRAQGTELVIQKYNHRWPRRHYSVYGEPRIEIVDSVRKVARAIVDLDFIAQDSQKMVQGSCEDVIYFRDATTNPNVISIKERTLSRNFRLSGHRNGAFNSTAEGATMLASGFQKCGCRFGHRISEPSNIRSVF